MGILLSAGAAFQAAFAASRGYPTSLFCWYNKGNGAALGGDGLLLRHGVSTPSVAHVSMDTSNNTTGYVGNRTSWGSANDSLDLASSTGGGSMVALLLVATSNSSITLYYPSEPGGRTRSPNNPNSGELSSSTIRVGGYGAHFAEFAVWTSALTAGDYAALAGGAAPETVSPGTLFDAWDLKPTGSSGSAAPSSFTGLVNAKVLTQTGGTAVVSAMTHPVTRIPIPTLTGSVTMDDMTPTGSLSTQPMSSMNGSVLLDEMLASGTLGLQPGTITSQPFKNWAGTLLPGATIPKVALVRISDMATVLNLTNQTTNGAGVLSITSGSLLPGVQYLLVTCDAAGTAFGAEPYTAI